MKAVALSILCGSVFLLATAVRAEPQGSPQASSRNAAQAGEKFGLTEVQRQAVFRELANAENRAEREAAQKFEKDPESIGQVELATRLHAQYQREIAAKYGLDTKAVVMIGAEGYEKGWSTTPPQPPSD